MASKALAKRMKSSSDLDYLVIDMPPGTTGSRYCCMVLLTTPQDLALALTNHLVCNVQYLGII